MATKPKEVYISTAPALPTQAAPDVSHDVIRNIHQRHSDVCFELSKRELKKTGAGQYSYIELTDILPSIHELNHAHGITMRLHFESDKAALFLYNVDNPIDYMEFTSPVVPAVPRGGEQIKSLGATQTYIRRYLLLLAYQIAIPDQVDSAPAKPLYEGPGLSKNVSRESLDDATDQSPEDALQISVERRCEAISRIWAVNALEAYWKGLSTELKANPLIIDAIKRRKEQLMPQKEAKEEQA